MTAELPNRADRALLGWAFAWSGLLCLVVAGIVQSGRRDSMANDVQVSLGFAMGGLAAAWTLIGTWIALIDLPQDEQESNSAGGEKQRLTPRLSVLVVWICFAAPLAYSLRRESDVLAQILLTVAIGILAPVIAMQWTRQRIRRESLFVPKQRSIRQILEMTTTIAVLIAALQFGNRWLDVPVSMQALVVSTGILWIVMMLIVLSHWWWIVFITVPMVVVQWIAVSSLVGIQGRDTEAEILRFNGAIAGFYLFALIFLTLMRSSGHRWISVFRVSKICDRFPVGD